MSTRVTQCPKCLTSFRVTEAQLAIANGAVRCGSCLQIFNAAEHWLESRNRPAPLPIPPPASDESFNAIFDDDFLIDDDSEIDEIEPATKPDSFMVTDEPEPAEPEPSSAPEPEEPEEERFLIDEDDILIDDNNGIDDDDDIVDKNYSATDADDELIFDEATIDFGDEVLIEDIEDNHRDDDELIHDTDTQSIFSSDGDHSISADDLAFDENTFSSEDSGGFLDLDIVPSRHTSAFKELDDIEDDNDESDESWAKKLLEDDAREELESSHKERLPFEQYDDLHSDDADDDHLIDDKMDPDLLELLSEQEARDKAAQFEEADEDTYIEEINFDQNFGAGERIGGFDMLANIEPEPVEFSYRQDHSRWRQIGWVGAIVVAVIALGGQYVYFNFDRLARDTDTRGWVSGLCSVVGCSVPSLDDITQIRSNNLMVRSHPTRNNALVVDAIITNRAEFQQPYPTMELAFTDLDGNVIASRQFQPNEYLSGELLGSQVMPSRQPVHIALELVDPGEQAVNYQIQLYRPE